MLGRGPRGDARTFMTNTEDSVKSKIILPAEEMKQEGKEFFLLCHKSAESLLAVAQEILLHRRGTVKD